MILLSSGQLIADNSYDLAFNHQFVETEKSPLIQMRKWEIRSNAHFKSYFEESLQIDKKWLISSFSGNKAKRLFFLCFPLTYSYLC